MLHIEHQNERIEKREKIYLVSVENVFSSSCFNNDIAEKLCLIDNLLHKKHTNQIINR